MSNDQSHRQISLSGLKQFLFKELAGSSTAVDVTIILLLMVFLFSSTLSIAVMNIGYGTAAILWVGRMVYRKRNDVPQTPLDMFLLAYVLAEALATIFAYNKEQSLLYMYRRVTLLPVIFVVSGNIRSARTLKVLFGTLVASMVFVSVWSLWPLFSRIHEFVLFQRRLNEFQMYMTAGGMMMMGLVLLLPFVIHPKTPSKLRWLAIAAMIPIGVNLLFTFTRSAWLGFITGAIVIGTFRAKKLFLPLVVLVLVVGVFSSPEMKERMSSTFNPYHVTNLTRLQMWETGIKIFQDHPIVGVGDIGIEQVWPFYAPPDWAVAGHLHNNLLMWLVTMGVLGFSALVALFVKIWVVLSRIERQLHDDWFLGSLALGALAVLGGFHVNGLFEWNFGDAEIIMVVWAIVGMTLAAKKVAPSEAHVG